MADNENGKTNDAWGKSPEKNLIEKKLIEKNLMEGMPLELVMKLEVRCDALREYAKMSDEQKAEAEKRAGQSKSKEETDRIIDSIAEGTFH